MQNPDPTSQHFDADTAAVLREQYSRAERVVNACRIVILGVLAIAGIAYAPHLNGSLNVANVLALAPLLTWAILQHVLWHARALDSPRLRLVNAILDVTAVSAIALSYGLFEDANLAVKSPILSAYFVILAARPFSGSTPLAILTGATAIAQYVAVVSFLVLSGRLGLHNDPQLTSISAGTSLLDEGAKVLFLAVSSVVAAYTTSWNRRTLQQAVAARRDFEARFKAVFAHSAVGVALLDEGGRIVEANDAMARLVGASNLHLVGKQVHEFAPAEHRVAGQLLISDIVEGGHRSSSGELRFVRGDGTEVWASVTVSTATGAREVRLIALVEDVTERKALEARLLQQAFYDGLTGLANRSLFRDRVEHALSRSMRERASVAVLFLDLDHFKNVNDTLGHAAGDALLRTVSGRLLNATRGSDTVARLGGDEFAVLLENAKTDAEASIVAERIVQSLQAPIDLAGGQSVRVTSSIGIARAGEPDSVDELLRNADVAMYAAKSGTRGGYMFFDQSMHTALVDRVMLESDLRRAIDERQLWVAYQPIVDLESGRIIGMEALARWQHPLKGSIPTASFIPVAEETGLIVPIGILVLTEACRQVAAWNEGRAEPLTVTVNLSAFQLQSDSLLADVKEALREPGLDPACLVLELTESVIAQSGTLAVERLQALKAIGVRLAVDDFGTGYSSLSYLQQFPVDILKIDRSFTHGLTQDSNDDALTRTIIALGDLMTLRTIAEGVEHEHQHKRLRDLGCSHTQGYLFSKPITAHEMGFLLDGHVPSVPPAAPSASGQIADAGEPLRNEL
jgi:diguanylate cyclase (GGDEF)-like protein/PAS domain S-box-containing protein